MSRRFPVYSQRAFLGDTISALIRGEQAVEPTVADNLLEDCLISLVLEEMCDIVQAQGKVGWRNAATVLDQALDAIERQLYQPDAGQWSQYWQRVRETLKQPASHLEDLQARLLRVDREGIPQRQRFEEGVEVPFEILYVPEIASLIAIPVGNRCYIDLDRVQTQETWVVSGEYFPFEVQVRDLTFVVSSAGEIILQTRNFPDSLVRELMDTLRDVAQTLYISGKPSFKATVEEPDDPNLSEPEEGKSHTRMD